MSGICCDVGKFGSMKFGTISDFIIDGTDIGFADSPLSNDKGSDPFDGIGTEVVVVDDANDGTAVDAESGSAFFEAFVLIAGDRLFSRSSSCISFFNEK